jgi:uncharacterized protein (TIGR03086 family)
MSTLDRWAALADGFAARIEGATSWDGPAPCDGWVALDVVRHVCTWMPALYAGGAGREVPLLPSVDDDPAAAWASVDALVRDLLATAGDLETTTPAGSMTLDALVSMTGLMDLLVHTWDLAVATGQPTAIDSAEWAGFAEGLPEVGSPMDQAMRGSGHFGPRTLVDDDADPQTQVLAFTGRPV